MGQRQYVITSSASFVGSVTESAGSSIGTESVRLIVDDGNAVTKTNVLRMLDELKAHIAADTWPPA